MSSSHDDTIVIWDFLNDQPKSENDLNGSFTNINNNNNNNNNSSASSNNSNNGFNGNSQPKNQLNSWLVPALNANSTNSLNRQQDLQSPSQSPNMQLNRNRTNQQRNNQNSPPSPMEGDD